MPIMRKGATPSEKVNYRSFDAQAWLHTVRLLYLAETSRTAYIKSVFQASDKKALKSKQHPPAPAFARAG